jgi:hypothetical protein
MKHLRIAVVPTETGNSIDQRSSVEEIIACEETRFYSLTDYFQAQNDEELGLHWSFILDYSNPNDIKDITGCNIDGIHFDSKPKIQSIVDRMNEPNTDGCITEQESAEIKGYFRDNYNREDIEFVENLMFLFPQEYTEWLEEK